MPATPYIVSVQIALVAGSAVYLKLRPDEAAESGLQIQQQQETPMAMAQAAAIPLPRPMGFRPGDLEQTGSAHGPVTRETEPVKAIPLDPSEAFEAFELDPDAPVPVSGMPQGDQAVPVPAVNLEELPPLDPVPQGEGYNITADSASNFDLQSRTVVFSGNVELQSRTFAVMADRLVVHMESAGGAMSHLVATGNVEVIMLEDDRSERFHGYAEKASFDPASESIRLSGWPRILGSGREHRAANSSTVMTLHTSPAKLETEGRATTRILNQ